MSNFINSIITVKSKLDETETISASKRTPEPPNDVVINLFQANLNQFRNPQDSLTEEKQGEGETGNA